MHLADIEVRGGGVASSPLADTPATNPFRRSSPVVEALWTARDLIARDGWCQRTDRTAAGAHCVAAAINESVPRDQVDVRARAKWLYATAVGALDDSLTYPYTRIASWNDRRARSVDEVLAGFVAAVDLAELEELS